MRDIRLLNINDMIYLIALKENDFHPFNASLDLQLESGASNVSRKMVKLEKYVNFPIFVRGDKKYYTKGDGIVGFTEKGQNLYFSIKTFIDSVMLVGKGNE